MIVFHRPGGLKGRKKAENAPATRQHPGASFYTAKSYQVNAPGRLFTPAKSWYPVAPHGGITRIIVVFLRLHPSPTMSLCVLFVRSAVPLGVLLDYRASFHFLA